MRVECCSGAPSRPPPRCQFTSIRRSIYIDEEELSRTESGPFAYTLTIPQQSHTSHIANTFVWQFLKAIGEAAEQLRYCGIQPNFIGKRLRNF